MASDWNPLVEYSSRLDARLKTVRIYERQNRLIGFFRLADAGLFAILLWLSVFRRTLSPWWMALPIAIFVALVFVHVRVLERKRRAMKSVTFYEDGIARIEDRWMGRGTSTESMRNEDHLYAPDLDIFGKGSLFELLCTARTRFGEETLANWLSAPAQRKEIIERQQAVQDLRQRLDLREDLFIVGSDIRPKIHPDALTQWGTAPARFTSQWPRTLSVLLTVVVLVALAAALASGGNSLWLSVYYGGIAIQSLVAIIFRHRIGDVLEGVELPAKDLTLFSELLARIERENFLSPRTIAMQLALTTDGVKASRAIRRLVRLFDALTLRELNVLIAIVVFLTAELIFPLSMILMLRLQIAYAIESWRLRHGKAIGPWLSIAGEYEALCSLAGYSYEHPRDLFPEIADGHRVLEAEDLCHPLIPSKQCVANSVQFTGALQLLVVSGSNMSGKSTLLRTVGINVVLALAGGPVRARRFHLSPFTIGATIQIHDSLQAGTSRFYAEITRIRRIIDLTKGDLPVLFLLDEILHGTNSHDRAIGAEAIMKGLINRDAIGMVTTHDLALTRVADALAPRAINVHFEDHLKDGVLIFDYKMKPGVVHKSNALELMRVVGIEMEGNGFDDIGRS